MNGLPVSVRASAVSLAVSGFLVAAITPWHPSIFDRPVDEVVRESEAWSPLHAIGILVFILALIGAAGLVAVHQGRLGRLGRVGLIVVLVGVFGAASLAAVEAIVFPVLAGRAPELLALDGPLVTSPLFIAAGVLALGWPLGLAILGLAAARARVFRRAPGILLAISGPAFLALVGPFVPIAGVLSAVVFGTAQIWWGWLMWRTPLPKPIAD
ncbi:hypothetical protein [Cryobacterium fucosi]|uniref:DUF4386 family protein n=1 Tax=Cryobacterium fucosi TaxID=1259157 RepID=A0A4R9BB30_9MICO|nr:hypothetical protein [Cryobacterium fucosi]TFD79467.1 hypothetical protein E3T48_05960 [Cryobacterium fucosi]